MKVRTAAEETITAGRCGRVWRDAGGLLGTNGATGTATGRTYISTTAHRLKTSCISSSVYCACAERTIFCSERGTATCQTSNPPPKKNCAFRCLLVLTGIDCLTVDYSSILSLWLQKGRTTTTYFLCTKWLAVNNVKPFYGRCEHHSLWSLKLI